ncbi:Long-chain-fatty-acid--CoA ligase [Geitlerinema sp. FC II]|nr:Long-chain-fatty-acid--CoA ligase [Geitlerinema sp. FC II]
MLDSIVDAITVFKKQLSQAMASSQVAIVTGNKEIAYQDLIERSMALANFWKKQGVRDGDRIAVKLPNSVEFVECYLACIFGGYTIIPLSTDLSQKNLNYILQLVKPRKLIDNFNEIQYEIISDIDDHELTLKKDGIAAIFFTSGTTSFPKAVCHRLENMLANALRFNKLVGLNQNVRMMHVMPMGYMAGFLNTLLSPLIARGTVIIAPQFNAKEAISFWQPAIESNVNAIWLTPTMAALLARLNRGDRIPEWAKDNLHHVFVGTAPLPKITKESFARTFGVSLLESYGMTEILIVASNTPRSLQKPSSVGNLIEGVEVEVRDRKGNVMPRGEEGTLYIKTPFALQGYLDKVTSKIDLALDNGWFNTGDYGYLDRDNSLFVTGRIKDLIIHGGMNVSPTSVENSLMEYPDIQEAVVIGKPHPFWGEEVVAFIKMKEEKLCCKESLEEYCKNNLEFDAIPTTFKVLNDFPRSSTGKVKKHLLKEML